MHKCGSPAATSIRRGIALADGEVMKQGSLSIESRDVEGVREGSCNGPHPAGPVDRRGS